MTLFLHASNSNSLIENLHLVGTAYNGGPLVGSSGQEPLTSVRFKRHLLENSLAAGQHTKWGYRLHNLQDSLFKACKVYGIDKEHACYVSIVGNVTWEDCHFFDCGAQGIQVVWRADETYNLAGYQVPGIHRVKDSVIEKCGQPRGSGRAAFAVSMFGAQIAPYDDASGLHHGPRSYWGCGVELLNTSIIHDSHGAYNLVGALMVEWRPFLTVIGGKTEYIGPSNSDLWHIFNVGDVLVDGHSFVGARDVDIDGAKTVTFKHCTGDVRVRINGKVAGLVSDNITWNA